MPSGPKISHLVDEALAQSSLPRIPVLAQAAKESHFSITTEMMSWEHNQDSMHLLRVIAILQYMLHAQTTALTVLAAEAYAAHGAIRDLAGEIDGGDAGRAFTAVADLSRRMPTPPPDSPFFPAAATAQAHPIPAMLDGQSLLMHQQLILEEVQNLETSTLDASLSAGR
jgi:hypothetical protein